MPILAVFLLGLASSAGWAASGTGPSSYWFNSGGGDVGASRVRAGMYVVRFADLHLNAFRVAAWGGQGHSCKVLGWRKNGEGLIVRISCTGDDGSPVDGAFSVQVIRR